MNPTLPYLPAPSPARRIALIVLLLIVIAAVGLLVAQVYGLRWGDSFTITAFAQPIAVTSGICLLYLALVPRIARLLAGIGIGISVLALASQLASLFFVWGAFSSGSSQYSTSPPAELDFGLLSLVTRFATILAIIEVELIVFTLLTLVTMRPPIVVVVFAITVLAMLVLLGYAIYVAVSPDVIGGLYESAATTAAIAGIGALSTPVLSVALRPSAPPAAFAEEQPWGPSPVVYVPPTSTSETGGSGTPVVPLAPTTPTAPVAPAEPPSDPRFPPLN